MTTVKRTKQNDLFVKAARQAVSNVGWSPDEDLEILRPTGSDDLRSAHYGHKASKVRLMNCPKLFEELRKTLAIIDQTNLGDPEKLFNDIVASRVYLKTGSFEICPLSVNEYAEIRDASADGLRSAGATELQVIDFATEATSIFIASVVSGVYGIEGPGPDQVCFRRGWLTDHIVSSVSHEVELSQYVTLYANIQLNLWGDNKILTRILRDRFHRPFDALEFETDRGISILLDSTRYTGFGVNKIGLASDENVRELIIESLRYDFDKWPIKAFQWAEMFAPYIFAQANGQQPPVQPQPDQIVPGGAGMLPSEEAQDRLDGITVPRPAPIPGQYGSNESGTVQLDGIPFDPFSETLGNDNQFLQELIQAGIGKGKPIMNLALNFDVLDAIYRARATHVRIESESDKSKDMTFDMTHVARKEADPQHIRWNMIDYGRTRFGQNSEPTLYEKRHPLKCEVPVIEDMSGFPDLMFVVDSSGSMSWDPRNGQGPYDCLLRAIYSVFAFLEEQGKGQHMKFAAVNFSGRTLKTSWVPFGELRKIKEMLFKHQRGGTVLDCAMLEEIVNRSDDRFLCLIITDGQISNSPQVFETVKMMKNRGHGVVMIQIGRRSTLSDELEKEGIPAPVVTDPKELTGLFLNYAQKNW